MSPTRQRPQLHEQLRELLRSAGGETPQVLAVFVDIRGFSSFSTRVDSPEVALYLRSVFTAMLDTYLVEPDYFKPTGDGLMVIYHLPSDPAQVRTKVNEVLRRSLALVENFADLAEDDILVNVTGQVPQSLGIGAARGSATRLISSGQVLDYTGKCLNLAARLMDKARPSGVVFHDPRANQILDEELNSYFTSDAVYIRGIAESEPLPIHVSDGVVVTRADREPIAPLSRRTWSYSDTWLTVTEVRAGGPYGFWLSRAPRSFETASVLAAWDVFGRDGKRTGTQRHAEITGDVDEQPEGHLVSIMLEEVAERTRDLPTEVQGFFKMKPVKIRFQAFLEPLEGD